MYTKPDFQTNLIGLQCNKLKLRTANNDPGVKGREKNFLICASAEVWSCIPAQI